jgi:hypothetical protein
MDNYVIIDATADKTAYERCSEISEALWTIARPRSIRELADGTCKFCSFVKHPSDSRAAIIISYDDKIIPNSSLVTQELFDSMPEYTTQKKTAVTTKLSNNHGVELNIGEILPTSFAYTTKESMQSDGWFLSDTP